MSRADREADSRCRATCPAVDKAFKNLRRDIETIAGGEIASQLDRELDHCCEVVKDQGTLLLRDALVSACGELEQAQGEIADLRRERDDLQDELALLRDELAAKEAA